MIKNELAFRQELEKANEWWLTGKVNAAERFPIQRYYFDRARKELEIQRVQIIIGPRRVGKSVLIKQMISDLIVNGIKPASILFYSMDDPAVYTFSDDPMKDMIDYFLEKIAPKEKKYIFLDEIHLFKGWHKWVKSYFDRYPDIKLVLSGSSSLALEKEAQRFLFGRAAEMEMFPMGFREFLKFSGRETRRYDVDEFLKMDSAEFRALGHGLKDNFNEYLLVGGMPEWFVAKEGPDPVRSWFSRLVEDVVKRAVYEDIASIFEIRNPRILELILAFIAAHQSKILAHETVNEVAGLDRSTLINYIEFLKSSYLIVEILKSAKIKEQMKAKKKYLFLDQGIRNALLKDYSIKEENLGFVMENVIGVALYHMAKERGANLFYHKTNGEVDFILQGTEAVPYEVKYRSVIDKKDVRNIIAFLKKAGLNKGVLVTKEHLMNEKAEGCDLSYIPAWAFLLII
jgi:predicted AAA+ superfamily ATPase